MNAMVSTQGFALRDMAEARRRMVDGQLRPNRVSDARLIAAMGSLPRERFLPPELAARAYADEDVGLLGGRALMAPMALARLIQLLAIRDADRVLVVGAGTGYGAAVIARCGARVVALDDAPALMAIARRATDGLVSPEALRLVEGPIAQGYASAAPYDGILIEGAVCAVPSAISDQLAEGGRLAAVVADPAGGRVARAVLGRRVAGGFSLTDAFDCATRTLPAFAPPPGFVF